MADVETRAEGATTSAAATSAVETAQVYVVIEEIDEASHRPNWGKLRITPVQIDRDGSTVGDPVELTIWLACRTYSKAAKALAQAPGPPSPGSKAPQQDVISWLSTRIGSTLFICSSATKLEQTKVFGPPMRTVFSGFEYRIQCFSIIPGPSGQKPKLETFADVKLPEYIPSALVGMSEGTAVVGGDSRIDLVSSEKKQPGEALESFVKPLHTFAKVPGKAISCMALHPKSGILVAVDDNVWPKFAFVFDCSSTPKHRFTAGLPEAKDERCTAAALGGPKGDLLVLTARFTNRMGDGQRLVILRVVEDGFEQLASHREFIPVDDDEDVEDGYERPPTWSGLAVEGDATVVGAGDKGVLIWSLAEAEDGESTPTLHDVGGTTVDIGRCELPYHLIVLVDPAGHAAGEAPSEVVLLNVKDSSAPYVVCRKSLERSPVRIM